MNAPAYVLTLSRACGRRRVRSSGDSSRRNAIQSPNVTSYLAIRYASVDATWSGCALIIVVRQHALDLLVALGQPVRALGEPRAIVEQRGESPADVAVAAVQRERLLEPLGRECVGRLELGLALEHRRPGVLAGGALAAIERHERLGAQLVERTLLVGCARPRL